MPISKPSRYVESIEILTEQERRRRRTALEKIAIVQETLEPGASVSAVARRHGVNANQVFGWRKRRNQAPILAADTREQRPASSRSLRVAQQRPSAQCRHRAIAPAGRRTRRPLLQIETSRKVALGEASNVG